MNIIVAVDCKWAIGNKNKLLTSIPADMDFFKEKTMGKTVIMGKNTLLSFPGGKPLKNRENIVIALEKEFKAEGAQVVNSVEEAAEAVKGRPAGELFVIGGASIYSQMLSYCDTAYVTRMDHAFEADTYFPNLDEDPEWELAEEEDRRTYKGLEFCFCKYRKRKKDE